ncbi:hypothetical protein ACFLT1_09110, partial [Bacteroidota bacterium]
ENVNVIAGYYGKYIIDYQAPEFEANLFGAFPDPAELFPPGTTPDPSSIASYTDAQIAGGNRLLNQQEEEFYHAAYAIVNLSFLRDQFELNIPGMYNFTTKEVTLMPSIKFNITDGLSFQVGAYWLYGEDGSLFDAVSSVLNAGYGMLVVKF